MKGTDSPAYFGKQRRYALGIVFFVGALSALFLFSRAQAANPGGGTIGPNGPALSWGGDAPGTGGTGCEGLGPVQIWTVATPLVGR
ncbi:MAG TPA: hypothetical protein VE135_08870 [Pyrinomonadaceae bacterium]|nr:hypothetical protein [Pyrinomonadaceae bacterium]